MRKTFATVFVLFAALLFTAPPPAVGQDLPEFSADALSAYAEGASLYRGARYTDAIPHFMAAYDADPTFVIALFQAALCHSNLGNISVRDSLLHVVAESKDKLSVYYRIRLETQLASAEGDLDRVLTAARRAAWIAPGTKAVYQLAFWANRRNRPREALNALLSLDPNREPMKGWASYWAQRVNAHHMLGEHDAEIAAARQAHAQYPEWFYPLTAQAHAFAASGRLDELEAVVEQSFSATPGGAAANPGALMTAAAAELAVHGNPEAAADLYGRSAAWYDEQPADLVASVANRNWRTLTLIGADRLDDAQRVCASVLEDAPNNYWFHAIAGYIAAREGNRAEANNQLVWLEERD